MKKIKLFLVTALLLSSASAALADFETTCSDGVPQGGPLPPGCSCDGDRISCNWG
ncbi:hypothetical protein I6M90_20700 [Acinetobacter bereziniae]|uniref:hypothetical protein n=1 Tax=Acinetobacter bereziniae TaxID=106648 RepID=UPI0019001A30|nr:hypothetical protein [Acinetobacter bereziniae]MBJ8454227.1 hypothetical protein [Acinetobacter bereziniae]MBJ8458466.1 hypothetical protein [Acinetobacter bereziniae]MDV8158083.1 hypothetical protein [Acinetobacter bereziniae]